MGRHNPTFEQRLNLDEEHQQLVAVDGLLYPDENSLGGSGWEGGVKKGEEERSPTSPDVGVRKAKIWRLQCASRRLWSPY